MLAQPEVLDAALGEAAAAVVGALAVAQGGGAGLHHLPVVGADGDVLVQRHQDPNVRVVPADHLEVLEPHVDVVMRVHDRGAQGPQQVGKVAVQALVMRRRHAEPVADGLLPEILVRPARRDGPGRPAAAVMAGEEEGRLDLRQLAVGAEQVVGRDLAAAGIEVRVAVARHQDAVLRAHAAAPVARLARVSPQRSPWRWALAMVSQRRNLPSPMRLKDWRSRWTRRARGS